MIAVVIIAVIVMGLFGAPIFAVMAAMAALGANAIQPDVPLSQAFAGLLTRVLALATGPSATTLSTIPLFTFAGYVMAESRTAERLVACARTLVGWVPGGVAVVTILACALFTTFTGASGVTIVAIGGLLLPVLMKDGYSERFALGLVTGTGSIGLLFPPALPLIIYGIVYASSAQVTSDGTDASGALTLVDFSVERFLFAGIVPGLLLVSVLAAYAVVVSIRNKVPRTPFDGAAAVRATVHALPELAIPVLILITMAFGILQIPEAAALTALYVLGIETLWYRDVRLRDLPRIARNALTLVGAIFLIIVSATALTDYFINANVPLRLYDWMDQYIHSRTTFLLALNVLLLIVGCLMDIFSAIVVVVPLIAPAAMRYGIDPYHLGVIFLLNLEIGYMTPPVGLNLFITSFRFGTPLAAVSRAVLPFILLMLGALALVTYVPALTPIRATKPKADTAAPGPDAPTGAALLDGGVATPRIVWPDGGVWTPARCDQPELKDDPLAHAECLATFQLWTRCGTLTQPLDKLECEQAVLDGKDPFATDGGSVP